MNPLQRGLKLLALASLSLAVLAAVACGGGTSSSDKTATAAATGGSSATKASGTAAATAGAAKIDITGVEELKDGQLDIGSDIAYAPVEFMDEKTNQPTGLDVDIASAMADVLGVKAKFNNGTFDGLLPALDAKRYDVIMSAMTASDSRKQTVDFVEYLNAGSGMLVLKGNPKSVKTVEDLCGLTVATQEGTVQVDLIAGAKDVVGQDKKCKDAGKPGITLRKFGTDPEAVQALIAGQADIELADYPVAAYSATQSGGKVEVLESQIDPGHYGIAIRKTSTPLRDALQKAFTAIKANGKYDEILKKWNLVAGKI